MTVMPKAVRDYLQQCIVDRRPKTLLVVSAEASIAQALADPFPNMVVEHQAAESPRAGIPNKNRFDLAVVIDALEMLPRTQAERLLGHLRDINASGVLAVVDGNRNSTTANAQRWRQSDFIALGFTRCADTRDLADGWDLYRYDMHDYKTTPSWLNSRYWANPERWGKKRW